ERAVGWWRKNPWSVLQTVDDGEVTGMCIALPVTESFYRRARSGLCRSHECTADDLVARSPYVIVEAVAPRCDPPSGAAGRGLSLVVAMICQQARVSDVAGICRQPPLRLLGFAGTPLGRRRLRRFGYRRLATHFPGTSIEYMERELVFGETRLADALLVGAWWAVQLYLRRI